MSEALDVAHDSGSWCEDVARPEAPGPDTQDTLAATAGTGSGRSARNDDIIIPDGTAVGRYIVVGQLGAGGMGVVYIAFDPELERDVALKLLHRETRPGTRARERLLREAQALARLSHPNVVRVYDVGEHDGQVFLAMEFVQGQTLRKWLDAADRTWPEILDVLVRAGRGLASAHDKDIVHRDVKPENVMVADDGRVLVMDFGLARAGEWASVGSLEVVQETLNPSETSLALTNAGAALGTPAYMAPEQHLRLPTNARTDQFSFCVSLYEALFRTRPFTGDSLTALSLAITEGRPRPPPPRHGVPARVVRAVERGLSRSPSERFATLTKLLDELSRDPRPARRRWIAAGAVAGAVGMYGGWQAWGAAQLREQCEAEGQAITTVWNDARRARVDEAVGASKVSYAHDSWNRASQRIDAHAQAWSSLRTETCLAASTNIRPELDAERSRLCFEERRTQLDAVLARFELAGPKIMQRMVTVVVELPRMDECTDEAWLGRRPADPPDRALRKQFATLRHRLVEVGVWISTGQYDDAVAGARAVQAEAEAAGAMTLVADARLAAGLALDLQGDYAQAQTELEQAYYVAGGTHHDGAALRAATRLSFLTGYERANLEDGLRWAATAEMLVTRLGLTDDPAVSTWLVNLGSIHQAHGNYDEALRALRRALEVAERAYGGDHPQLAALWANLGNTLHGRGETGAALAAHRRGLEIRENSLGPNHPEVGLSLGNMGATLHVLGRYGDAQTALDRAVEIQVAAFGERHGSVANTLNNLGAVHFSLQDFDAALQTYRRALEILSETRGPDSHVVANTHNNIGRIHGKRGEHELALGSYQRALEIRIDSLGPQHPLVAKVHNNMARTHRALRAYDEAIAAHERAREIWTAAHGPRHARVAAVRYDLGITLLDAGRPTAAVGQLELALEIQELTGASSKKRGRSRLALAQAFEAAGRSPDQVLALANEARQELVIAKAKRDLERLDQWMSETAAAD
ncbi:MAG: tetratricopeptide repeat protein [Deltaproteobacteria bacterium]|nr:tetratricopeptide repeat protein [Deltaproteobacteria bacterium]